MKVRCLIIKVKGPTIRLLDVSHLERDQIGGSRSSMNGGEEYVLLLNHSIFSLSLKIVKRNIYICKMMKFAIKCRNNLP